MTLQEIKSNYETKLNDYKQKEKALENSIAKYERLIEKKKNEMEKLYKKYPGYVNEFLKPLAEEIKSRTNAISYEIFGPFGITCEISVYFEYKNGIKKHVMFTYSLEKIFTGKRTNEYAPGSIGDLNGFNNIYIDTPETIEEIIEKYLL